MATITISKQLGSLGGGIARGVAETLNYEYADNERIGKILSDFGVDMKEMLKFDEKKPPLWETFLLQRVRFIHALQGAIYDLARMGKVVIVGRGGQVLLRNLPGALHVRVVAPFALRVKRLSLSQNIDETLAASIILKNDQDSAGYLQTVLHADLNDASLYDLVINTEHLSPDTAVQLIIESVRSGEIQEGVDKKKEKLAELAMIQKVEARLLPILETNINRVRIKVEKGVVTLKGGVASRQLIEECARAVTALEGVDHVENELSIMGAEWYGI